MNTMDTVKRLQVNDLGCIRQQKILFSDLSFQLHAGEVLLIEGPNGSGKSSLLRLLTGLSTPSGGDIFWCHENIQSQLPVYWNQLHYMGHSNGIKSGLTVTENLQLTSHLKQLSLPKHVETILEQLHLQKEQHTLTRHLSAGQKRRVALAKLLLFPKSLWILDEPLTALDANTQTYFLTCLEEHVHHGGLAIVSSHHPFSFAKVKVNTLRLEIC